MLQSVLPGRPYPRPGSDPEGRLDIATQWAVKSGTGIDVFDDKGRCETRPVATIIFSPRRSKMFMGSS